MVCHVWLHLGAGLPDGEIERFRQQFPCVEFSVDLDPEDYAGVDAVFTRQKLPDELTERLTSLKWIHTSYGGGHAFLTAAVAGRGITVTSSRGVQAEPLSEFTEACVLGAAKKLHLLRERQRDRRWDDDITLDTLSGKVAGLLGLGAVGSAVAQRLHKHGMKVRAVRRNVQVRPAYVESVCGLDGLTGLLKEADFLIIGLPPLDAIRNLIGVSEFRTMKETCYVINLVTRGIIADAVLARALREGWIAGAACNVFEINPLPENSELWDAPNLLIVPGVAQTDPLRWQKLRDVFTGNLQCFLEGAPMQNVIDGQGVY